MCIAPEVAVEFQESGRTIDIVNPSGAKWYLTHLAIKRLAALNKPLCAELVGKQLCNLQEAMYKLSLDPVQHILRFFRILFDLSAELFERFVTTLNFDDPIAKKSLEQLVRSQPKERIKYEKLARCGQRLTGRIAELSTELLGRLTGVPSK
jgi:hypothetical protein